MTGCSLLSVRRVRSSHDRPKKNGPEEPFKHSPFRLNFSSLTLHPHEGSKTQETPKWHTTSTPMAIGTADTLFPRHGRSIYPSQNLDQQQTQTDCARFFARRTVLGNLRLQTDKPPHPFRPDTLNHTKPTNKPDNNSGRRATQNSHNRLNNHPTTK